MLTIFKLRIDQMQRLEAERDYNGTLLRNFKAAAEGVARQYPFFHTN